MIPLSSKREPINFLIGFIFYKKIMFKLSIPITKSYKWESSNILIIEWIASDSTIDRDNERFSDEAVKWMSDSVNNWGIKVKIEHQDNIFSEVWDWKEATMIDWKMFVKWEVDLDLSMGRDIEVLLKKGFEISLSVGWMVRSAMTEFNKELWKTIKVYTDILLKEISIVKNPANYNATLSLAKSFDFKKNIQTEEALELEKSNSIKANKPMKKSFLEVEELIKSSNSNKTEYLKKGCKVKKDWEENEWEPCIEVDDFYEMSELTWSDYRMIWLIYKIYATIWVEEILMPQWLTWEELDKLPDFSFIPLQDANRLIPYMDAMMKLRKDWIEYGMYQLAKWEFWWICATDRKYAMEFLYSAYRQILISEKSNKSVAREIREDEIDLMKKCIEFKKTKTNRPQIDWNDLSDKEINQLAKAYWVLSEKNILKSNINTMNRKEELEALIAKHTAELQALEVAKSEVPSEVLSEASTEISIETTEEVVTEPVAEVITEEVVVEEVVAEEVKIEEVLTEEVTESPVIEEVPEIVVGEDTGKSVEEPVVDTTKNNTNIDETLLKAITSAIEVAVKSEAEKTVESISLLEKSLNEKIANLESLNETSKSLNSAKEQENEEILNKFATAIELISNTVKSYWESSSNRKSVAVVLEKSQDGELKTDFIKNEMKTGLSFAQAYAKKMKQL